MANQRPSAEKQEVDGLLFLFDVPTNVVHGAEKAGVCLDEAELAFRVHRLAFGRDPISSFLRAADEVNTGLAGILGKVLQRRFADPAGGTNEDGDEAWGKSGGDAGV